MSDFIRNALQSELDKMRREIKAYGFDLSVDEDSGTLKIVEVAAPAAATLALPEPTGAGSQAAGAEAQTAEGGRQKAGKNLRAGATCAVLNKRGAECGGTIGADGTCPKCRQREYQRAYAKKHAKKA